MTARLSGIAPRLKKLLLMLSSDRDGEVLNAAHLISSTLRASGRDWHDLAGVLTESPKTKTHHQTSRPPPRDQDYAGGDWHALREFCRQHDYLLRSREREFISNLGDWRGSLTEKQTAWLHAIHARLRRDAGL
jgi:hypothetical protein